MQKKIVLLVALIILVIGVWLYLFFTLPPEEESKETTPEEEAAEVILPEPWDFRGEGYVIIGVEDSTYHIISGELAPEQIEQLAEKVIEDILDEDPGLEEIALFFYRELIVVGIDQADVARIDWTAGKINIEIK